MRQWVLKNNLSSGELSPLLWTRTDVQQYGNGTKKLLNAIPLVEGGAKKRPGTRFRGVFTGAIRLIPFIPNSENAYMLILGINTLQVYDPRSKAVVYNVSTPYDTARKINEVQFAHTRYRMYLTQGESPVHRFICSADFTNWQFSEFNFVTQPTDEINSTPSVALKPSGKDVGQTISLTASSYPTWSGGVEYIVDDIAIINTGGFGSVQKSYRALLDNKNKNPETEIEFWIEISNSEAAVFNSTHIGSIVSINGGQVKITSVSSASVALGEVLVGLNADVQAIAKSWTLSSKAFTAQTGYPKTVVFFKQRLVFANTKNSPNQMWFSAIGNDGDYLEATEDSDAFSIASSSAQSDNILHLAQRGGVVALTGGSEFLINSTGPLTPASAQIDQHTSYGVQKDVRPCLVGNELLFVQRGGERLRALSYRYEVDGLTSPELSAIAAHITQTHQGIKEIAYQQTPNSLVWMVLNDGKVASITLNRDQEMNAWAQHDFGCTVLSMCTLPTGTGADQCFMLTDRNGGLFLEELIENALSDCEFEMLEGQQPSVETLKLIDPIYNWSEHDGYFYSESEPDTPSFYYGQPFEFLIDLLPPDFSQVPSTTMFHKISVHEAVLYVKDSIGGFINEHELQHKKIDQWAFQNQPYNGYVEVSMSGWDKLYQLSIKITHNKPLPFHVQSISMLVSINER